MLEDKDKYDVNFQKLPSPVDRSFENIVFMDTPLNGEELKN